MADRLKIPLGRKQALPVFLVIAGILFGVNAFPSLYGDEYGSLFDAYHLSGNIHAIGYFSQLRLWNAISQQDWFLRTLSLIWLGAGLYWLDRWLRWEKIADRTRNLILWLAVLNPFLWVYGFQIRFYAMFFAASILFAWRFRAWGAHPSGRDLVYLLLSTLILLTSHLFGWLVVGMVLLSNVWENLPGRKKWELALALAFGIVLLFFPPVRALLVSIVFRTSNPYADLPVEASMRGLSLGMLAKVPLTFYFFTLGERVYPLWWWVTLPAMLVMGSAFLLGVWQLRRHPALGSLSVFMLLNIPLMFLVLDPLAPPGLQGSAPRYLIFVVPYFLFLLALGAGAWKPLVPALILVNLVGLYFLAAPAWSYGGTDFVDWRRLLAKAVPLPGQTCVITDGRSNGPVSRYILAGTKIGAEEADCNGFPRIVLVSNDHRLAQVRYLDEMAGRLAAEYGLVSNTTLFPAQVTVYGQGTGLPSPAPFRLDLPEQDLRFPILVPQRGWQIQGFVRLDGQTPVAQLPLSAGDADKGWVLTNYRSDSVLPNGTPVFHLQFTAEPGNEDREIVLRSGMETSAWDGGCSACLSVYQWTKRIHLLGTSSYPGAYRQYPAHIWGFSFTDASPLNRFTSVTVTFLLPDGTGYFYGIFPEAD